MSIFSNGYEALKSIITDAVTGKTASVLPAGQLVTNDFMLEVAKGNITGHASVNKFGANRAAISGADIWTGGGAYAFYPTSAQAMAIVSDSVNDTSAGTGARTVTVFGLDTNWDEISETVTMNGVTPVNLVNSYRRMFRGYCVTAGTVETNDGNISVDVQGGGDTAVYIAAGDGQTLQCIYTVPHGFTGYFVKGYVGLVDDDKNGETAEFQWQARPNNGVTGAWAVKGEMGLNNIGSSWWQYEYGVPSGPIAEKTDIRIRVTSATAILGVVGGFDFVLVED